MRVARRPTTRKHPTLDLRMTLKEVIDLAYLPCHQKATETLDVKLEGTVRRRTITWFGRLYQSFEMKKPQTSKAKPLPWIEVEGAKDQRIPSSAKIRRCRMTTKVRHSLPEMT
jgi:hypothetical protein